MIGMREMEKLLFSISPLFRSSPPSLSGQFSADLSSFHFLPAPFFVHFFLHPAILPRLPSYIFNKAFIFYQIRHVIQQQITSSELIPFPPLLHHNLLQPLFNSLFFLHRLLCYACAGTRHFCLGAKIRHKLQEALLVWE